VTNFKRFSRNNTHIDRDNDGTETIVCKVGVDGEKNLSWLLSGYSIIPKPPPALASQRCKQNSTVQQLVPVITLVATASNDFVDYRSHVAAAAGQLPYIIPSAKTKKDH